MSAKQPSIFDILAEESFGGTLKPAFKYILTFLSSRYPSTISKQSIRWFDELYLLLDAFLQNYYLKHYGASFAENFYGFKRVIRTSGLRPTTGLTKLHSLFFLVNPTLVWLTRFIVPAVSACKMLLNIWSFILQLMYITSRSAVHSPLLWISNVKLEQLSKDDIMMHCPESFSSRSFLSRLIFLIPTTVSRIFGYFLFFIQFLDLFYNSELGAEFRSANTDVSRRIPPAPHEVLGESFVHQLEPDMCPLCLRKRIEDTVLSVSGYVFCYNCIRKYVLKEKRCPVSGFPANLCHLIKLYPLDA
uniref:Peroxisome assembly protein 12 n=1 Tax=Syphacia muris TaxID=451379 RepID=A0A0N5AJ82_9BILA